MLKDKRILIGVCGGIAAFKSAALVSALEQLGVCVRVAMTESATRFVTPLTFQSLSKSKVIVDMFSNQNNTQIDNENISHIDWANEVDLIVIAPATANMISKIAVGLADDFLSTVVLASTAPLLVAPAMNSYMYLASITQHNISLLKERGVNFIEPGSGVLACGHIGKGRMAEPDEIIEWIKQYFSHNKPLAGKHVLITAGPTVEMLDPAVLISNRSTGKMGVALAEEARQLGAKVTLISGPISLTVSKEINRIDVRTAEEMLEQVLQVLPKADVIIKAAAVSDYRPIQIAEHKMKKHNEVNNEIIFKFRLNPDIAYEVGKLKNANQILVGFAAESQNIFQNAKLKLENKNMDLVIANDITAAGAGFASDTNIITMIDKYGEIEEVSKCSKQQAAKKILDKVVKLSHMRSKCLN